MITSYNHFLQTTISKIIQNIDFCPEIYLGRSPLMIYKHHDRCSSMFCPFDEFREVDDVLDDLDHTFKVSFPCSVVLRND